MLASAQSANKSSSTASSTSLSAAPSRDIGTPDFSSHDSPADPVVVHGAPSTASSDSRPGGAPLSSTEDDVPSSPSDVSSGSRTPRTATPSVASSTPASSPPSVVRSGASAFGMQEVAAAIDHVAEEVQKAPATPSRRPRRRARETYNVRQDEPPPHRFHSPAVQAALDEARSILSGLGNVMASGALHMDDGSTIGRLHKQAQVLSQFQCLSTRKVGFVGASGVGKSSLLNSLLDMRGLARANSNGDACTSVVTEYHHHDRDDFAIVVELFSADEVVAQVTSLFESLRLYESFLAEGQFASKEEVQELEKKARVATCTFDAMFRGQHGYHHLMAGLPDDTTLSTLQQWTHDRMPHHLGGYQTLDTLSECSEKVMQLTSETNPEHQSAVWPYIRKIEVFVKAHILSKGLVLVDLPGLRDVNLARQVITEMYLRECDDIFAVCGTSRAIADASVKDVIHLAAKARLSNVGIICTKSDEILAAEATDKVARRLNEAVETCQRDVNDLDERLKELDADAEELLEAEKQEQTTLLARSWRTKNILETKKTELKIHVVDSVAARIASILKKNYGKMVPDSRLHVFCVSNRDYWEVRDRPKSDAVLRLLNLSGIPAVRKHCLAMVADSNLQLAAKYVNSDIPALLGDIGLWVETGAGCLAAEQKQLVRDTLDGLERRLKREFSGCTSSALAFSRPLKKRFASRIYNARCTYDWADDASRAANGWACWHHSTYSAFCRAYGDYCTPAAGSHNWNEEAMAAMVGALRPRWMDICTYLREREDKTMDHIAGILEREIETLDTALQDLPQPPETLIQALSSREALLAAEMENLYRKVECDLSTLETDALTGIRSSLFGKAMEGAYMAANNEYGPGSHRRRISLINGTVTSFRTYEDHLGAFRARFCGLADDLQRDIDRLLAEHLQVIRDTLDLVRDDHVVTESEQNPELRRQVKESMASTEEALIQIQAVLA